MVCLRLLGKAPGEWGVEQKAIERFEAAAARVEKDLMEVVAEQSATKRELTLRKFNIAEIVADYVVTATGKPPTVWKSADFPSPFVGALAEIFEILEFEPGHERAAMHAIKAIGQNPRKYFDFGL